MAETGAYRAPARLTAKGRYQSCALCPEPLPCPTHLGCYAAGHDRCQDVRTTVTEDNDGRQTVSKCHACGNPFAAIYEPWAMVWEREMTP